MGFRDEGVLTATATFQRLNLPLERVPGFKDELLERLRAIPGVESAALTQIVPLRDWGGGNAWIDGAARQPNHTSLSRVGPGYFKTLEVPLIGGRDFDGRDRVGAPLVAMIETGVCAQVPRRRESGGPAFVDRGDARIAGHALRDRRLRGRHEV